MYQIKFTKQAVKDIDMIKRAGFADKVQRILAVVRNDPFQNPPPYEKLIGDLKGMYARRINIQHRFVYEVYEEQRVVKVIRLWKHYE